MDEMVSQESVQAELQALAGPKNNAEEEEEYAPACCTFEHADSHNASI